MARTKDFDENEVLTKAMHLFWEKGYLATSMEELVTGLGISRSSLYGTYMDKHTLFIKSLEHYQQMAGAKLQDILKSPGSAKQTVKKLIEHATGGLSDGQKQTGCFMVNAEVEVAPHDKKVSKLVCQNDQQMEDIFCQVIKNGQKIGEIKNSRNARVLAKFMSNTIKGLQVTAKSTSDKSVFNEIILTAVSILDQN
jgi:TetR/AcrR family transcriptional regulator, transcriptional repressor for nem operon